METRPLGRTGHRSSIVVFGGFAVGWVDQAEADAALDMACENGINHIDVSPLYGEAEARIGSWIGRNGRKFFLACKTHEREKATAWESLQRSLENLKIDSFDLFQFHGVDSVEALDKILGPGGAMEAVQEAKAQGLLRYIGITGHNPPLHNTALQRFDFDTVLFPLNRIHAAHPTDWNDFRPVLQTARQQHVGVLAIKSVAKGVWPDPDRASRPYNTWYQPFDDAENIEKSLRYTLSQDITAAVLPGDLELWPAIIDTAQRFKPMTADEQEQVMLEVEQYRPLAGPNMG
jgi:aryl-alcohol dehydrogenase-like predicted oxidoreductase